MVQAAAYLVGDAHLMWTVGIALAAFLIGLLVEGIRGKRF